MTFEKSFDNCHTGMDTSNHWKVMKDCYDKFFLNYKGDKTQKIPKILHQIWLGGSFPDKYKILTDRWQAMHPDWTLILWDEKKIEEFGMANKWMYVNMKNPSAKSDVVRYEIAYSYGGVYVDTDFLCCKSLDDLLYLDMFCGVVGSYDETSINGDTCIAPSIFGCTQGNELIGNVIRHIGEQIIIPRSIFDIMTITGPEMFSRKVLEHLPTRNLTVVFPPTYLYPFPGQLRENIRQMSLEDTKQYVSPYIYSETYAMHLWYCSWQNSNLL